MADAVTLVVLGKLKSGKEEVFAEYAAAAGPMLIAGGGTPVARMKTIEQLKGQDGPQMIAMMSFDSAEAVKAVFDSAEYKAIVPKRDAAFEHLTLLITEPA